MLVSQTHDEEFAWEAEPIGKVINRKPRQVYPLVGKFPGLKKIEGRLCLHVPTWRRSFEENAAVTQAPSPPSSPSIKTKSRAA